MVLSYVRMLSPLEEAMARYGRWIGSPEPTRGVSSQGAR